MLAWKYEKLEIDSSKDIVVQWEIIHAKETKNIILRHPRPIGYTHVIVSCWSSDDYELYVNMSQKCDIEQQYITKSIRSVVTVDHVTVDI